MQTVVTTNQPNPGSQALPRSSLTLLAAVAVLLGRGAGTKQQLLN
jgi:hypothetical protein